MAPAPFFMLSSFSDTGTIIFKKCLEFFVVVVTFRVLFSSGVSFLFCFAVFSFVFCAHSFPLEGPILLLFIKSL